MSDELEKAKILKALWKDYERAADRLKDYCAELLKDSSLSMENPLGVIYNAAMAKLKDKHWSKLL